MLSFVKLMTQTITVTCNARKKNKTKQKLDIGFQLTQSKMEES